MFNFLRVEGCRSIPVLFQVILPHLVRVYRVINSVFKDYYCISMRSKFPCCICGKKSSNSGFINPVHAKIVSAGLVTRNKSVLVCKPLVCKLKLKILLTTLKEVCFFLLITLEYSKNSTCISRTETSTAWSFSTKAKTKFLSHYIW